MILYIKVAMHNAHLTVTYSDPNKSFYEELAVYFHENIVDLISHTTVQLQHIYKQKKKSVKEEESPVRTSLCV